MMGAGCEGERERTKGYGGGWAIAAKVCDSCKSAPAQLFCRADSAFLCLGCDPKVHGSNKLASRHERVWMCEVCEQAPANVTCKADAAALCVSCDADIHSANPLSRRHERFPIVPFYDSPAAAATAAKSPVFNLFNPPAPAKDDDDEKVPEIHIHDARDDEEEVTDDAAASWLLCNSNPKLMDGPNLKSGGHNYFFADVDPYLDLDYASSMDARFHHHNSASADSVVPVQTKSLPPPPILAATNVDNCFAFDFSRPKSCFSYSHSVSSSSLDVGIVPEGSMSGADVSNPFVSGMKSGSVAVDLPGAGNSAAATALSSLDREARVMRYREKRKNRKFEKTIRYASRKAYAETRPRIKGRFAKRTEIETDVDRIYSATVALMADAGGYGVVPSF